MSSFKSGYGQAKADILQAIAENMKLITKEINSVTPGYRPTPEQARELRARIDALRWVRAIIKAQKSPH